jgi:membrane protease subunit HflK
VVDPELFMFGGAKPASLFIGQYLETAMREVIATRGVDDLLVSNRSEIALRIQEKAQDLVNSNRTGVVIESIQMVSVSPPSEVAESFRDVASAREDKNTYISEALAYQNELVPVSRGESAKVMLTAKADMQKRIDMAFGEANRFEQRSKAYRSGSEVTRSRLYLETMEKALPKAKKYIIDPKVVTNPTQLWLAKGPLSLPTQR